MIEDAWLEDGCREALAGAEDRLSFDAPIHSLADGFGGAQGPAEGPLWWKEGKYLLFSDIHNNRRMKYEPGKGVSVFLEPTNRANGLTRDLQGRLVAGGQGLRIILSVWRTRMT